MKKFRSAALIMIILNVLVLTACVKDEKSLSQEEIQSDTVIEQTTSESEGDKVDDSNANEESVENGQSVNETADNGASIVAKSNNTISDSEKKKILDELNTEIDSLIKNVNELEDAQDSDLTY